MGCFFPKRFQLSELPGAGGVVLFACIVGRVKPGSPHQEKLKCMNSFGLMEKQDPRKQECQCGYIVYDPFTSLLTRFPEKGRKDALFVKALRNPLVREMPPSLRSTVMVGSCTPWMLLRAARVKKIPSHLPGFRVPEVSGGTTTGRSKVISVEGTLTVTILKASLEIRIVRTSDILGRNQLIMSPSTKIDGWLSVALYNPYERSKPKCSRSDKSSTDSLYPYAILRPDIECYRSSNFLQLTVQLIQKMDRSWRVTVVNISL